MQADFPMDIAALSRSVLAQLRTALAAAIAQATPEHTSMLGERREVALLAFGVAESFVATAPAPISADLWIDAALQVLLGVVHQYGGVVAGFAHNTLIAVFGTSHAYDNIAHRAARVALALQQAVEPLDSQLRTSQGLGLSASIGLHIGTIIQGQRGVGEVDYILVGDAATRVAQLQRNALAGTLRCSPVFYERTRDTFVYKRPVGEDDVWLLQHSTEPRQALAHVDLVGRDAERALLLAHRDATLESPGVRLAVISGDVGIGKSRLVDELRDHPGPARCLVLHCDPLNRAKPLVLAAELLNALLGIGGSAALPDRQITGALEALGLPAEELLPYVEHVIGVSSGAYGSARKLRSLDPTMLQRQTHLALRRVSLAAARRKPLLLVVENLQWIDPASRDFLEYLFQSTRGEEEVHMLIVLVGRERDAAIALVPPSIASNRDTLLEIAIAPLSAEHSQTLAAQLLAVPVDIFSDLPHQIALRAAGNPLYIEELSRRLLDRVGKGVADAFWTASRVAAELGALPDTLQGLLLSRFGELPERLRRILQRAAVLGRSFPVQLLEQIESSRASALPADLATLIERQFLVGDGVSEFDDLAFSHALLHEAIYQTLLLPDRQRLHGQVALALETVTFYSADERNRLLAYHHAESASPWRALPYLLTAAERSARSYANETAIYFYRRALQLLKDFSHDDVATIAQAQYGLGRALIFVGQYAEASTVLSAAVAARRVGAGASPEQILRLAETLRELAETYQRDNQTEAALATLAEGLQLVAESPEPAFRRLWRSLVERTAALYFRQGDFAAALRLAETAVEDRDEAADDPITMANLHNILGGIKWQHGDLDEAGRHVAQSLQLFELVGYSWALANAYTNLGILNYSLGRWAEAAEQFERSELLRKETGYMAQRAVNLKNLGVLQAEMGRYQQAQRSLETSLAISRSIGDDYGVIVAILQLADLALIQQRNDEAQALLQQAEPLLPTASDDEYALYLWLTGLVASANARDEEAVPLVERALDLAVAAGIPELEIDCRRLLGMLFGRRGLSASAERELFASLELSVKHASIFREGLACYELGWYWLRQANNPHAAGDAREQSFSYFQRALARFTALDARHAINRVSTALEQWRNGNV